MGKIEAITGIAITAMETVKGISELFETSIGGDFYNTLDKMAFLNTNGLSINSTKITDNTAIFNDAIFNLSNLVIWSILLFYVFKSLFKYFLSKKIEVPWKLFIRMIIFGILANSSCFICYSAVYFTEGVTEYIQEFTGNNASFSCVEEKISELNLEVDTENEENDIFIIEDFFKIMTYFSVFILTICLGVRFIMLKTLIIFAPVFIIFGGSQITEKLCFTWAKFFIFLLSIQIFILITLGILSNLDINQETIMQILLISTLIMNIKAIKNLKKLLMNS